MLCSKCSSLAVIDGPVLCKGHFMKYVEDNIKHTLAAYGLAKKGEKIAVAVSGGKDSLVLLSLLKKLHGNVEAIAIDEGISGYREKTLIKAKNFCRKNHIMLRIYKFKDLFGFSLDSRVTEKDKPCSICGTLRRYALNKYAHSFDKIATGHNMDDEAQAILMNILRFNWSAIPQGGPSPGIVRDEAFVPRIKPLYFLAEKEVALYAVLTGLDVSFAECPNAKLSYRAYVRDMLNEYEFKNPGAKKKLIGFYLSLQPKLNSSSSSLPLKHCLSCNMPCKGDYCGACMLMAVN